MKECRSVLLALVLLCGFVYAEADVMYLRLRFTRPSDSRSIKDLCERRVLPKDSCWAEQSVDTRVWELVRELPRKVKVGLALSGGGDRGIVHVGVLKAFEENNIPIDAIAGTSMGAIVGGLYASGYSIDSLEELVNSIDWKNIFSDQPPRQYLPLWERLNDKPRQPALSVNSSGKIIPPITLDLGTGLRTAQKFTDELAQRTLRADYYSGFDFDSLGIPYGVVVVNINRKLKNTELIRHGTISTVARASGSLPLTFEPVVIKGISYIDGGVLDDLPVDAFIPFDECRGPEVVMNRIGRDTINYVIGVYALKMRGERDVLEDTSAISGALGLGLKFKTADLARACHLWKSWDMAHARIDVDVTGMFDFAPEKMQDKICKGYYAAKNEILEIKYSIARLEERLSNLPRHIHRLSCVRIFNVTNEGDTLEITGLVETDKIRKAIRFKEGSYVEKVDICDALKRIFALGDYVDLVARIDHTESLHFIVKEKNAYTGSIAFLIEMGAMVECDSVTAKVAKDAIFTILDQEMGKNKRILNYDEIKELVEKNLVEQGFVCPRVGDIVFIPSVRNSGTLSVSVSQGTHLSNVNVSCNHNNTERDLEKFFKGHLSPGKALTRAADGFREFQLKTITFVGSDNSTLEIEAERQSTSTLEIPSITLENVEGLNFFAEYRVRRWSIFTRLLTYSAYFNYTHNFPLKEAQEFPRGQRYGIGLQRGRSISFGPDINIYWKRLGFSTDEDSLVYNTRSEEFTTQLDLPFYFHNLALIPGFEVSKAIMFEADEERPWSDFLKHLLEDLSYYGNLQVMWDNLDRITFPEKGLKAGLDVKIGEDRDFWWRARAKILGAASFRVQKRLITIMGRLYVSHYSDDTPYYRRYSLGGLTPIGSYQLRVFEAEDLVKYPRNAFIEPWMWKVGGALRLALMEMSPLRDLRFNLYLQGSYDVAEAIPLGESWFSTDRITQCPSIGLYVDTNYFNLAFVIRTGQGRFFDNFHISLVYYGLGF